MIGPTHTNGERVIQDMYIKGQDSWRSSWNSAYYTISVFAYLTPNYKTSYLITEYHPKYGLGGMAFVSNKNTYRMFSQEETLWKGVD